MASPYSLAKDSRDSKKSWKSALIRTISFGYFGAPSSSQTFPSSHSSPFIKSPHSTPALQKLTGGPITERERALAREIFSNPNPRRLKHHSQYSTLTIPTSTVIRSTTHSDLSDKWRSVSPQRGELASGLERTTLGAGAQNFFNRATPSLPGSRINSYINPVKDRELVWDENSQRFRRQIDRQEEQKAKEREIENMNEAERLLQTLESLRPTMSKPIVINRLVPVSDQSDLFRFTEHQPISPWARRRAAHTSLPTLNNTTTLSMHVEQQRSHKRASERRAREAEVEVDDADADDVISENEREREKNKREKKGPSKGKISKKRRRKRSVESDQTSEEEFKPVREGYGFVDCDGRRNKKSKKKQKTDENAIIINKAKSPVPPPSFTRLIPRPELTKPLPPPMTKLPSSSADVELPIPPFIYRADPPRLTPSGRIPLSASSASYGIGPRRTQRTPRHAPAPKSKRTKANEDLVHDHVDNEVQDFGVNVETPKKEAPENSTTPTTTPVSKLPASNLFSSVSNPLSQTVETTTPQTSPQKTFAFIPPVTANDDSKLQPAPVRLIKPLHGEASTTSSAPASMTTQLDPPITNCTQGNNAEVTEIVTGTSEGHIATFNFPENALSLPVGAGPQPRPVTPGIPSLGTSFNSNSVFKPNGTPTTSNEVQATTVPTFSFGITKKQPTNTTDTSFSILSKGESLKRQVELDRAPATIAPTSTFTFGLTKKEPTVPNNSSFSPSGNSLEKSASLSFTEVNPNSNKPSPSFPANVPFAGFGNGVAATTAVVSPPFAFGSKPTDIPTSAPKFTFGTSGITNSEKDDGNDKSMEDIQTPPAEPVKTPSMFGTSSNPPLNSTNSGFSFASKPPSGPSFNFGVAATSQPFATVTSKSFSGFGTDKQDVLTSTTFSGTAQSPFSFGSNNPSPAAASSPFSFNFGATQTQVAQTSQAGNVTNPASPFGNPSTSGSQPFKFGTAPQTNTSVTSPTNAFQFGIQHAVNTPSPSAASPFNSQPSAPSPFGGSQSSFQFGQANAASPISAPSPGALFNMGAVSVEPASGEGRSFKPMPKSRRRGR